MKGKVLIAEPFIQDVHFVRSVILIAEHAQHGSLGYVLNQATHFAVNMLVDGLSMVTRSAHRGGPVEPSSLHYLHSYPSISGSVKILDGVYWSGDFEEVCHGLLTGTMSQDNFRFFTGYSGWSAGQLQDEINQKAWMIGDLSAEHIFDETKANNELWRYAVRKQGGTNALLANAPKDPFLN